MKERGDKAARALDRLHRQGLEPEPVLLEGRTIARTFWGRAWCDNLESYSDCARRLAQGRSRLRAGALRHLEVRRGRVRALVSGARLYEVAINIRAMPPEAWRGLQERATGRIPSALDLLRASLPEQVLRLVTDRAGGLFPALPEIQMRCTCPDRAFMCQHIAAALYGVGARLDSAPQLLFLLRGVDPAELAEARTRAVLAAALRGGGRPRLPESRVEEIFGLELEGRGAASASAGSAPSAGKPTPPRSGRRSGSSRSR